MQIVIDIPEEFEEQFNADRFAEIFDTLYDRYYPPRGFMNDKALYVRRVCNMVGVELLKADILPKKHGPLIDLDVLKEHIVTDDCDDGCGYIDERDLDNIPVLVYEQGEEK